MFTAGRAGGVTVLVWEAEAALSTSAAAIPGAGWHSDVPAVVVYHCGGGRTSRRFPEEFTRQLDSQFRVLCSLSAREVLAGMVAYEQDGRSQARTFKARDRYENRLRDELRDRGLSPSDARRWSQAVMGALLCGPRPEMERRGRLRRTRVGQPPFVTWGRAAERIIEQTDRFGPWVGAGVWW